MTSSGLQTVRTMCPMNCHPTLCGMLVDIEDGRVLGVRGDPDNPDSQGFLCVRGQASHEIIGNPARLLHPLVRARRDDAFREASWDEALDLVAERMRALGGERVGVWTGHGLAATNYGTRLSGHLARRFANLWRSEEHTSELQSHVNVVCRLLLEKKNTVRWGRYRERWTDAKYYGHSCDSG